MIISEKIKRIKCKFGYHKYFLVQELTSWSRKIGCKNCSKLFGMNDNVKIVIEWDKDLEEMYKRVGVL